MDDKKSKQPVPLLGVAIAIGAGLGTVMFVITDAAGWIGIGAGLGVIAGAVLQGQAKG
jgi:hypothetical protein